MIDAHAMYLLNFQEWHVAPLFSTLIVPTSPRRPHLQLYGDLCQ